MGEPLTLALITELMPKLYAAFPRTIQGEQRVVIETYRNGLRGLSGDAVRAAVDRAIQEDQYFPKVAKLRDLATKWQRHNMPAHASPHREAEWGVCPICGARAAPKTIVRRRRDPKKRYALVLDEHGQEVWEEVQSAMLYMEHDPVKHRIRRTTEEVG